MSDWEKTNTLESLTEEGVIKNVSLISLHQIKYVAQKQCPYCEKYYQIAIYNLKYCLCADYCGEYNKKHKCIVCMNFIPKDKEYYKKELDK